MDTFDEQFINNQFKETNMSFLPDGYEVPKSSGNYMKFIEGKNKFRVLSSAIVGYEWWVDQGGARTPKRVKTWDEAVEQGIDPIKPFWAFVVWNYNESRVQILELTQKGLMGSIKALVDDEEWGDPKQYDLTVTRTGKDKETKYALTPSPAKILDNVVVEQYKSMNINLNALYAGDDPFGGK